MRPRAGNTRPYGIPETLVYSAGADDSAARTFTEISRQRRADEDIRPYGIPEPLVYFVSVARLFTGDSPLPAGGASPSPTASSKGPTYPRRSYAQPPNRAAVLFFSSNHKPALDN